MKTTEGVVIEIKHKRKYRGVFQRYFYRREDLDAFIKRMNSTISHEKNFKEALS
ncbi:MAG: hypothetical protein SPK75_02315 [Victivallales bacterium]|nr:hypothetical protein [Victivallales bacterium]